MPDWHDMIKMSCILYLTYENHYWEYQLKPSIQHFAEGVVDYLEKQSIAFEQVIFLTLYNYKI